MSALRLEGVSKHWGTAVAVEQASFATRSGALVVLLGPSGCGKSTTLRMIAGLDTPSAGRILIDERDVTAAPPADRRISMVFQSYALFPHLSVAENILFGVKVRKEPSAEHAPRLARVAELLGLTELLQRKPSQLSGGQQQRVAIARALANDPQLILADEPTGALDTRTSIEIMALFQGFNAHGMTVVLVTHEPDIAAFARRILRFRDGRLIADEAVAAPRRGAAA